MGAPAAPNNFLNIKVAEGKSLGILTSQDIVSSITESETKVPSAKAVYDAIGDISSALDEIRGV